MYPAVYREYGGSNRAVRRGADRAGFALHDAALHAVRADPRGDGGLRSAAEDPGLRNGGIPHG